MSVFNGERYLKYSIDSLLNQTFKDFELIIIDDGSYDNSKKIIENFSKQDKRIILINHERKGLTKSLNIGIRESKGKYIARHDADDLSLPTRLEKQWNFLEKHNDYGLVGTNWEYIYKEGNIIKNKIKYFVDQDH